MKYIVLTAAFAGLFVPVIAHAQGTAALTEPHARSALAVYGCNNISSLSPGPEGSWHGQCSKGGATVNVVMDSKGAVTSGGKPTHMTEPMARSAMLNAGCGNISQLSAGPANSWHGQCAKGGAMVNAMVDSTGVVTTGQTTSHVTEANARSVLAQNGCSNISTLSAGADGSWNGQCAKGGKTSDVSVSDKGVFASR